jgi:predicted nucleic acid-binding protein
VIVLDTNVLSELMRASPHGAVSDWVASQPEPILYTTSITQAEILFGLRLLTAGRKRRELEAAAEQMFELDFAGRVLPFDSAAAAKYAGIAANRRQLGRPISPFDAQIAAIASNAGAAVATANVVDFADCGVRLINPWQ